MRSAWHIGGSDVARSDNVAQTGWAQKRGGVLRTYMPDSGEHVGPTRRRRSSAGPDVSMQSVVPDLATV